MLHEARSVGPLGLAAVMLGALEKTFPLLAKEKSRLVGAAVVNCCVFLGQASVGDFEVHFIPPGSRRKSLSRMIAFPFYLSTCGRMWCGNDVPFHDTQRTSRVKAMLLNSCCFSHLSESS